MNRAGPGRQCDKQQMHLTLDWTGLSSLVFLYIAKLSSKTSYLESAQVLQPQLLKSMTCSGTRQTVMALLWKGLQKSWGLEKFTARWAVSGLMRSLPKDAVLWLALQVFSTIYTQFVWVYLSLYSTTAEWTHIHILRPDHPMLKKGGFTVRHLAPISKRYKDRIRTNKEMEPMDVTCTVCTKLMSSYHRLHKIIYKSTQDCNLMVKPQRFRWKAL